MSADQGRTWALHTQVWGEESATCVPPCVPAAGYSSMVAMGDGVDAPIGLLYDRNNVSMVIFEAREVAFVLERKAHAYQSANEGASKVALVELVVELGAHTARLVGR